MFNDINGEDDILHIIFSFNGFLFLEYNNFFDKKNTFKMLKFAIKQNFHFPSYSRDLKEVAFSFDQKETKA